MGLNNLFCTAATVGMLQERGLTLQKISKLVKEPVVVVRRYLRSWMKATDYDRELARSGTKIPRRIK